MRCSRSLRGGTKLRHCSQAILSNGGLSLIELLVGVVLLALAAAGTIGIFRAVVQQSRTAATRNELQASVDANAALVLQANDRYRCSNLTAIGANCEVVNFDPNENQYAPAPFVDDATNPGTTIPNPGFTRFQNLCDQNQLTAQLITAVNALAAPQGLAVRQAAVAEAWNVGDEPHHRYQVTWVDNDGNLARRLVLSPTVARWCP